VIAVLEGKLFFNEKNDEWVLVTEEKVLKVNTLIYALADLGVEYAGEGEEVRFNITGAYDYGINFIK
jgi:hypothetical protein